MNSEETAEIVESINAKLYTIIRLLALSVAPASLSVKDRALILHRAGLAPKEIAAVCDTTPNTISVLLSAQKRAKKKAKR